MSENNRDGVRKSIFGTLKSRFSSRKPEDGDGAVSPVSPRAVSPNPSSRGFGTPTNSTPSRSSRNPPANHSEPTERSVNEPPPPYTAVAELPGSSAPAAPAAHTPLPGIALRPASPTPSQRSSASVRPTIDNVRTAEDPYAFLTMFDTIFVIDDSGSMAGSPWREVKAVLANILPICTQRDADGIDIYFLNHRALPTPQSAGGSNQPRVPKGKATGGYHNITNVATVGQIFDSVRPGASTPTGARLHSILQPYIRYYEAKRNEMMQRGEYGDPDPEDIKPVNIIVITDGVPTDDLDNTLITAAKKLDQLDAPPHQVGVQFFQVGKEREAAAYLQHLDDNLGKHIPGGIRDMVDTVTWDAFFRMNYSGPTPTRSNGPNTALGLTADGVLKVVLGAVVKRLDQRPVGASSQSPNNRYLNASR
ncbi:hypothetical protein SEUCBS139899_006022 [Sporothrix eucalyptigena]|uniref:VWFA domain-containing protein n=1 Tax=Sporothrix eucalyptigena TaxID=1812306 RepID=A0ABP0CXW8_9PEZI